ncbi:NUDIX domain-containing protein [Catellatospora coxensis]
MEPLGAEVWVFDPARTRVVLVRHPWRAWVPPGGRVEPGETPREGGPGTVRGDRSARRTPRPAGGGGRPLVPSELAGDPVLLLRGGRRRLDTPGRRRRAAGGLETAGSRLGELLPGGPRPDAETGDGLAVIHPAVLDHDRSGRPRLGPSIPGCEAPGYAEAGAEAAGASMTWPVRSGGEVPARRGSGPWTVSKEAVTWTGGRTPL